MILSVNYLGLGGIQMFTSAKELLGFYYKNTNKMNSEITQTMLAKG